MGSIEPTEQVEFEIPVPTISPNLFNPLQKPAVLQLSIEEFLQLTLGSDENEKQDEG